MPPRLPCLLVAVALATGCTSLPEVPSAESAQSLSAPYPDLVPVETLRLAAAPRARAAGTTTLAAGIADPAPEIDDRAARLKARAARLRGDQVIDEEERKRLEKPVTIPEEDA